mgnify:CR=1 FL=1
MKKLLLILFSVLSLSTTIFAVDTNGKFNYAAGFVIGSTNGFNGLAYDGEGRGYQLTLSLKQNGDSKIGVSFDKLFFYDANENLPIYAGIGLKLSDEQDKYVGIRGVFGISYFANALSDSVEIFGEIAPTIYLTSINDFVKTEYAIGARYYF